MNVARVAFELMRLHAVAATPAYVMLPVTTMKHLFVVLDQVHPDGQTG